MVKVHAVCLLVGALIGTACRAQEHGPDVPQQLVDQGIRAQFRVQPSTWPIPRAARRYGACGRLPGYP